MDPTPSAGAAITPAGVPTPDLAAIPAAAPAQARSDAHLLALWLFGKSPHTRRAYRRVAGAFLAALAPRGLRTATLGDLQTWAGPCRARRAVGRSPRPPSSPR